jgi:excisionase family DNA binding protein
MTQQPDPSTPREGYAELLRHDSYTPEEAAYLLGMDLEVIQQAAHRHTLKATFIGKDIVSIDRGDLVQWLESR